MLITNVRNIYNILKYMEFIGRHVMLNRAFAANHNLTTR
jgi:hypothetical protein